MDTNVLKFQKTQKNSEKSKDFQKNCVYSEKFKYYKTNHKYSMHLEEQDVKLPVENLDVFVEKKNRSQTS